MVIILLRDLIKRLNKIIIIFFKKFFLFFCITIMIKQLKQQNAQAKNLNKVLGVKTIPLEQKKIPLTKY